MYIQGLARAVHTRYTPYPGYAHIGYIRLYTGIQAIYRPWAQGLYIAYISPYTGK